MTPSTSAAPMSPTASFKSGTAERESVHRDLFGPCTGDCCRYDWSHPITSAWRGLKPSWMDELREDAESLVAAVASLAWRLRCPR